MPDSRRHRGPHPQDRELFSAEREAVLRRAVGDLSWLLTRRYSPPSAIKLVGDRYRLEARQRTAVARAACGDHHRESRSQRRVAREHLAGEQLWIDGYNVLTSLEAALSGGVILLARDGCCRDLASMHGSYRRVEETRPAMEILGELLCQWRVSGCRWLLDAPVSNSGRLKTMLLELAGRQGWAWEAELVPDPDPVLAGCERIVASADSQILDAAPRWFNLAHEAISETAPSAWVIDLRD